MYLELQAWEIKERKPDRKQTHIIKQSYPKELFDKLTEEQKQSIPIIGDAIVWGFQEPEPNNFEVQVPDSLTPQEDDLPF